jgi:hypothetical protein
MPSSQVVNDIGSTAVCKPKDHIGIEANSDLLVWPDCLWHVRGDGRGQSVDCAYGHLSVE